LNRIYSYDQELADLADEEKAIPWAEGSGLWRQVSRLVDDLVGVDLVTFFVQNPYTCDSAENLAVRVGRSAHQVKPVLESLASTGLLRKTDLGDLYVYDLTDDPRQRQTLQQYVSWLQEGYHWTRMVLDR
jgi:hypothetical protein